MIKRLNMILLFLLCLSVSFAGPQDELVTLNDFDYEGAFRIQSSTTNPGGSTDYPTRVRIAHNPDRNSFYVTGLELPNTGSAIALSEYPMTSFSTASSIANLPITSNPTQSYITGIFGRTNTGNSQGLNLITGMEYVDGKLIVNANTWYDAAGDNTHTTLVIDNPNNLANSNIRGFYELYGAARGGGWMSEIPSDWQSTLGNNYLYGYSSGDSIISRFSVGPSAFAFDYTDLTQASSNTGSISGTTLLDYIYPNALYDPVDFPNGIGGFDNYIYDGYSNSIGNDIWNVLSNTGYGFIIPGTRTYAVFGNSAGHNSNIDYKSNQNNGNECGGPCQSDYTDLYNYYWLYDVNDLVDVKNGVIASHEVVPYEYGIFTTPLDSEFENVRANYFSPDYSNAIITGADYDPVDGKLYLLVLASDFVQSQFVGGHIIMRYTIDGASYTPPVPDNENPTVSLTSPNNGATISGMVTVSANANDNQAISNVEFFLGSNSIGTDSSSPYSISFDTTQFSNGNYQLSAVATDTSSNTATSSSRTITVDNQIICTPNWSCTGWGACSNDEQSRTCTDLNSCGTNSGKPSETQSCSTTNPPTSDVCAPYPAPDGEDTIITVSPSQAGQLRNIVGNAASGTTIYLEDGYYDISSNFRIEPTNSDITIRSLSGNRDAVIIDAGYSSTGPAEPFYIAQDSITVADLTIQNAYYHPFKVVNGGTNLVMYNLKILDGRQQLIKVNPGGSGSYPDSGTLACSHVEITDAGRSQIDSNPFGDCYTGGIDAHSVRDWKVYNNVFKDIRCDSSRSSPAQHAVNFWSGSRDNIIENNLVINNDRGLGLGLCSGNGCATTQTRTYNDNPTAGSGLDPNRLSHIGGVIRNNVIYEIQRGFNPGIGIESAYGAEVYHNTIYSSNQNVYSIDIRFAESIDTIVKNNLIYPFSIGDRNAPGGLDISDNLQASLGMFNDPNNYDFSLIQGASAIDAGANVGVTTDITGNSRDSNPDIGAYEYGSGSNPPICTPNWTCTAWSVCSNNQQTRTCSDSNSCGTNTGRPSETQSCSTNPPGNDDFTSIYSSGITVDGNYNDWSSIVGKDISISTMETPSSSDLSGTVKSASDNSYLYFLIEVTDDSIISDNTLVNIDEYWADDVVGIFLDTQNDNTIGMGSDDLKLIIYPFEDIFVDPIDSSNLVSNPNSVLLDVETTNQGYNVEIGLPFSELSFTPSNGLNIGIDIALYDDDNGGGADGELRLYSDAKTNSASIEDTNKFGELVFSGNFGDIQICPNSIVEGTELCDSGTNPSQLCDYGLTSCQVCTNTCTYTSGITSYCGDNVCDDSNENQNTCAQDCTPDPVCGDGNIDSGLGETCDGTNFGSQTCNSLGYEHGSVSCYDSNNANACTFDTSGCYNDFPSIELTSPTDELIYGTDTTSFSIQTNELSTCRYGLNDVSFDSMNTFDSSDGSIHTKNSIPLNSRSGDYNFYIRCRDTFTTPNENLTTVTITVSEPPETIAPEINNPSPNDIILDYGTSSTTVSVRTDEVATCRYQVAEGISYENMPESNQFTSSDGYLHELQNFPLSDDTSYAFYAKCIDQYDNTNTDDFYFNFSVGSQVVIEDPQFNLTEILSYSPLNEIDENTNPVRIEVITKELSICRLSDIYQLSHADYNFFDGNLESNGTTNFIDLDSTFFEKNKNNTVYVSCFPQLGTAANNTLGSFSFNLGSIDTNTTEPPVTSPPEDTGSSSGGGGGSSSSSRNEDRLTILQDDVCKPDYNYPRWSTCLDGIQKRTITDDNGCEDPRTESRICKVKNSELENKFLNAKKLIIEKIEDKKRTYRTTLTSSYNEIISSDNKLDDETFVLVDEESGEEYLGRLVEENNDEYFYSLERIDENLIGELKAEGLVDSTTSEKLDKNFKEIFSSNYFKTGLFIFSLLLIVGFIYYVVIYMRKVHD